MIHGHGLSIILSNDIDNGYHLGIVMSASNDVNVYMWQDLVVVWFLDLRQGC